MTEAQAEYLDRAHEYIGFDPQGIDLKREFEIASESLSYHHAESGFVERARAYVAAGASKLAALYAAYFESRDANRMDEAMRLELYGPNDEDLDRAAREAEQELWNEESTRLEAESGIA